MEISRLLANLRKRFLRYQPVVEIFVYQKSLINNYKIFQKKYPKLHIAPVLKANAYGHGLVEVGRIMDAKRPRFIIIDSIFEALRLRHAGIKSPLLIIGYTWPKNILKSTLKNTQFAITALETLQSIVAEAKKPVYVQLKFDTGMHRQGIPVKEVSNVAHLVNQNKNIHVTGIFSHFSDADNADLTDTNKQILIWNELAKQCRTMFPEATEYHLAATYGAAFSDSIDATLIRLGIGLYGLGTSPYQTDLDLQPALEMVTVISSLRTLPAGEKIGYGGTYTTTKECTIATIPVGYNEGVDRRLSSVGAVYVNENMAPIVGRVSMNITSIDVSNIKNCKMNDPVQVISCQKTAENSLLKMSEQAKAIPYELAVHIPPHLRRTVL